jgi:ubiquinone/menaquinone biosynthesis C-methylase UbiE
MNSRAREVNFENVAEDYARYRGGFPKLFFDQVEEHYGTPLEGQRVLDIGCGTGALANEFARRGCEATGMDPSEKLLAEAEAVANNDGLDVNYLRGAAEDIELQSLGFDLATAARCWHWLDRGRAALELRRVLRKGGMLVICHFDRIGAAPDDLFSATRALIEHVNPAWIDSPPQVFGHGVGVYPKWLHDLAMAGFQGIKSFSFDVEIPYSHDAWRGRVRSSGGVGGSLSAEQVTRLDAEVRELLLTRFQKEPVVVTQRLFCAIGRTPP